MQSVYLAGPITGQSYLEATEWRKYVREQLSPTIQTLSPMRGKEFLEGVERIDHTYEEDILTGQSAIVTRDFFDVSRADVIAVNFLGATKVSIGTVWEIGAAFALRKPIILAYEPGSAHDHAFIRESARNGFTTHHLADIPYLIESILLPDKVPMWRPVGRNEGGVVYT